MFVHLKAHLTGKAVILGIGSSLRGDDAVGSLLAGRIKGKVPYTVYDAGSSPENYLGKIIKDNPDNIIMLDAGDFGGSPGEFREFEGEDFKTVNFFSTHDASLQMAINYLQGKIKANIIALIVQPKDTSFGETLSPEIEQALRVLEEFFIGSAKEKR